MTITANPLTLDDETILERVLVIAARRGLPVHHVTIQDIEGRKTVALDLEVDGAMTLGDAHRLASELEDAIAEEIGEGVEVETHIEPAEPEAQRSTGRARSRPAHRSFARRHGRGARTRARHPRCSGARDLGRRVRSLPLPRRSGDAGRGGPQRRRFAGALDQASVSGGAPGRRPRRAGGDGGRLALTVALPKRSRSLRQRPRRRAHPRSSFSLGATFRMPPDCAIHGVR